MFTVHDFLDKSSNEILRETARALNQAGPKDLFLIYYSGHGKLDRNGSLCLATKDTYQDALLGTSIRARRLMRSW